MRSYQYLAGLSAAALLAFAAPSTAAAQACLGDATLPGNFLLGAYGTVADGGSAYGVESRANPVGPVGMGARIGIIDLDGTDENLTSAGGHLAFDLARGGALEFCPVVGVEYDFWEGSSGGVDFDYSRVAIPVGLAVGSRMGGAADGPAVIPSAQAGFIHQRFGAGATAGPIAFQRDGNATDLFIDAGATVQFGPLYARGGIYRIFQDEAETVVRLGLGFVF
jgi:hypothetical protein